MEQTLPRVLIVDDNPDTLNLIRMGLSAFEPPFIIDMAVDAKTAAEAMQNQTYKAIILDVSLPDVTGATLGEIIRKQNPDLPLAFLTNYNGPTTHEHAKMIGAYFWYKPKVLKDLNHFVELICGLLSGSPCDEMEDKIEESEALNFPSSLTKMMK